MRISLRSLPVNTERVWTDGQKSPKDCSNPLPVWFAVRVNLMVANVGYQCIVQCTWFSP